MNYTPGSLVSARGREWIVQPRDPYAPEGVLRLRPLSGTAEDEFLLDPVLEPDVSSAVFPPPSSSQAGHYEQALHLRNALRLSMRSGAGPFRSFGNLAFAPRAYQLVPLMMALRQKTVRLLIADDVGIGKTIESGMILREFLDRGEIQHASVLCPPPLVDQWIDELKTRFHLNAQAVTSSTAAALERQIPDNHSIFEYYPFTVVSLDYIKSDRNAARFRQTAPEFIIVDEAHTCTHLGGHRQLRWQLIHELAQNDSRHMLFVTATPHSGNEQGFINLLSLLNPKFSALATLKDNTELRKELALYFVQRRRADLREWKDDDSFPKRDIAEVTYRLDGPWKKFFNDVLAYCRGLLKGHSTTTGQDYVYWYATLGLLRCASSSPAAAVMALQNRLDNLLQEADLQETEADENRVMDFEEAESSDAAPAVVIAATKELKDLQEQAATLSERKDDPKLECLIKLLKDDLLKHKFSPIIFCRYVATAKYVAQALKQKFKDYSITAVTGQQNIESRNADLEMLAENDRHILVATDCLAEGLNVQRDYNAVVHYDLLWNPSRHQQREGRVDRFGQHSPKVRCAMLYGQDNPIDGMVLNVISRKARQITEALGVAVSVPMDEKRVTLAILQAGLFKHQDSAGPEQLMLFTEEQLDPDAAAAALKNLNTLQAQWEDAADKEKKNRTIFAQRSLKPDDIMPEWHKVEEAMGSQNDLKEFVIGSLAEMGSRASEPDKKDRIALPLTGLPPFLNERLKDAGIPISSAYKVCFSGQGADRAESLTRSHPLVAQLASGVLENALDDTGENSFFCRCATAVSPDIQTITRVYLLRLRHHLETTRSGNAPRTDIVEEAVVVAVRGVRNPEWIEDREAIEQLLHIIPSSNLNSNAVSRQIDSAMEFIRNHEEDLNSLADRRSRQLLEDHRRIRDASGSTGSYSVSPILPVDIVGAFVLLPEEE